LALGARGGLRAALERGVPEPRDLKRLLVELQRTVVIRLPPPRWNVLRRHQPLGVVGSARDLLGLVRELASEIRVALLERRARAQQERLGQIVHREARTGEKRGTLGEAPPGFGQARPRKDFRMDDLGQNLETLDDPWTRAIEVR
jgi:hypothetical protein